MFERFTERAREVLALAGRAAQRFHHDHVGTEHLLLALVREGTGLAAEVLAARGVDLKTLRRQVTALGLPAAGDGDTPALPQTTHVRHVLDWAVVEARTLHHNYLGTEHLLLALLRETDGVAHRVLQALDLSADDLRADVLARLGEPGAHPAPLGPLSPDAARAVGAEAGVPGLCHVVMWRLSGTAAERRTQANALRTRLESLPAEVPAIRHLEVGLNRADSPAACDLVLVTRFDSAADLAAYRDHPAHREVAAALRAAAESVHVVDYET